MDLELDKIPKIPDNSSQFTNSIDALESQLSLVLEDFKSAYVIYNMNPNDTESEQNFENVKNTLNEFGSKLFTLSNNVEAGIDNINTILGTVNKKIDEERKQNEQLKKAHGYIEKEQNAAEEMHKDYQYIYDKTYLENWSIILGLILFYVSISSFSKKGVNPIPVVPGIPVPKVQVTKPMRK